MEDRDMKKIKLLKFEVPKNTEGEENKMAISSEELEKIFHPQI